jgi:hypothetical protein
VFDERDAFTGTAQSAGKHLLVLLDDPEADRTPWWAGPGSRASP